VTYPDAPGTKQLKDAAQLLADEGQAAIAFDVTGALVAIGEPAVSLTGWHMTANGRLRMRDLLRETSAADWAGALRDITEGAAWTGVLDTTSEAPSIVVLSAKPVTDGQSGAVLGGVAVLGSQSAGDHGERYHRLEAMVHHAPAAFTAIDADERFTEWNRAAELLLGWTRTELIGADVWRLVPPECEDTLAAVIAELREGREIPPYKTARRHRDGHQVLVQVHASAVFDSEGEWAGAVASYRGLSHGHRRERQIRQVLDTMPVAVATFDRDATVTYAAGVGYRRAGVGQSLAVGVRLLDVTPAGTAMHEAVKAALAGRASDVRVTFDERLWRVQVAPLGDGDAALLHQPTAHHGGFLSAFDITSEREIGDRLAEVLAVSPICLVTFDAGGVITYAAGSGYAALGISPESTLGLNMLTLYGDNLEIREAVRICLSGEAKDLVVEYAGRLWDLHYRPFPGASGAVAGGIGIAQDATDWLTTSSPAPPPPPPRGGGHPPGGGSNRRWASWNATRSPGYSADEGCNDACPNRSWRGTAGRLPSSTSMPSRSSTRRTEVR
jgi:PAS domain S-box-containing protein